MRRSKGWKLESKPRMFDASRDRLGLDSVRVREGHKP